MTKAGARDNAGTGDDFTRYYSTFAKEDLETIVGLYADMFQHLSYAEADFKTEARAILGEYNKNSADPLEKLFEVQRDRFYPGPHLQTHHDGVHQRHREHAERVRLLEDVLRAVVPPAVHDRHRRRRRDAGAGAADGREVLGRLEGRAARSPRRIPKEPAPNGPLYVHVPWASDTLPWVTVGFPGPAFDETSKESAAMEILGSIFFGQTSDLYKKLVVTEQKVDQLEVDVPSSFDPSLFTVLARVKNGADTPYVRDQILAAVARARASLVPADRLADAQVVRSLFVCPRHRQHRARRRGRVAVRRRTSARIRRSTTTTARWSRSTPADLQSAARKYFDDRGLIVATLSRDPLPAGIERAPSLASLEAQPRAASGAGGDVPLVLQKSLLPQLDVKLLFTVGSAHDPAGKEGLAALTAAMLTRAGSKTMTIDQIDAALYPTAASFTGRTDKEMTTLTGLVHRDQWQKVLPIVLPQLLDQGWRQEDFDARQDAAAQRARAGSPLEQRRGAREGAAADEHLSRHAVRPRRARHRRRPQRHHAGRCEGASRGRCTPGPT